MGALLRTFIAVASLAALPGVAHADNITGEDWSTTQSGEKVSLFTLKSGNGLEARITNYGGRISHGGSFALNGKTYQLEKKDPNAPFVIHGSPRGNND